MASDASFAQFVVDQITAAGAITTRFMFGEYALYCNEKVVALICDNKLFVKPTDAGRKYIGSPVEAPAYPGAKPSFLIEEKLEDRMWLTELIRITEKEMPAPKPQKKNAKPGPRTRTRVARASLKKSARSSPGTKGKNTKAHARAKATVATKTAKPKKKAAKR